MGSRAAAKLKEIEKLRGDIEKKLDEFEHRFPIAGFGRKAAVILAGSGLSSSLFAVLFRRSRGKRREAEQAEPKKRRLRRKRAQPAPASPPTVVHVNAFPKGAAWLAAAGVAAWAGVRAYEAWQKTKSAETSSAFRPAVVTPMPEGGRQTGSGS